MCDAMTAELRWIARLDMNALYASAGLLRYPELHGRPVVIGGGAKLTDGSRRFRWLRDYAGPGSGHHVDLRSPSPRRVLGDRQNEGRQLAPDAILLPTTSIRIITIRVSSRQRSPPSLLRLKDVASTRSTPTSLTCRVTREISARA